MPLLQFSSIQNGTQEAELSLGELYDAGGLPAFESRWETFFASDPAHPYIYHRVGTILRYQTGYFVPIMLDDRPPVLLLFGNPASHSSKIGMCFSYEGKQRKHRFWSVLAETGFLEFLPGDELNTLDVIARNTQVKRQFLGLDYVSPFRVGIAPILSMPSTASAPPWSGVGGLYKLFGKRRLSLILEEEKRRVRQIVHEFLGNHGVIVAFQKDAYESVRLQSSAPYSLPLVKVNQIESRYIENPTLPVLVGPPTRFWTGQAIRNGLTALKIRVEHLITIQEYSNL